MNRRLRARLALVVTLCVAAGACSRGSSPAVPESEVIVRAPWRPIGDVSFAPVQLDAWVLSEEEQPLVWRALLSEPEIVDAPALAGFGAGARVVRFGGDPAARVVIKGEFDPLACTHLSLRVATRGEITLRAALVSAAGEMRTKSRPWSVDTGGRAETVQFPLRVPEEREPCNRIVLFCEGDSVELDIGRVELLQVPLAGALPDAAEGARPVAAGEDWRPAVGLSSARGLRATWTDVGAARELVFALAPIPPARAPDPLGPVRWRLRDADGGEVRSGELQLERGDPPSWRDVRVALDGVGSACALELEAGSLAAGRDAVCAVSEPRLEARVDAPPTVLLITSDTHRADHLGLAGAGVDVRTPTLDALAERGVYFERCMSTTNVTNPSHVALMTAVSPRDTRILGNTSPLADAAPTLAEVFRDAGWATFATLSARHLDPDGSGLGQGFDRVHAPRLSERSAAETLAIARSWLDAARDRPLFLWVHLFDAHTPYAPPGAFDRLYYGRERNPSDPSRPALDVRGSHGQWLPDPLTDLEYPLAQYRAEVTYLDDALAGLLSEPRLERAWTCFVGDHGESLGDHGVYWDHAGLYAQTIHVPLIFAGPGVPTGARSASVVSAIDVGRTLLSRVGLAGSFPGRDLLEALGGEGAERNEPAFALSGIERSASVTRGRWHLILDLGARFEDGSAEGRHAVELFDLDADPGCERELAEQDLAVAAGLRRLLVAWLAAGGDRGWRRPRGALDSERLSQLAQMGYVGGAQAPREEAWIDPECECSQCERFAGLPAGADEGR